jgi:hypothetical protein
MRRQLLFVFVLGVWAFLENPLALGGYPAILMCCDGGVWGPCQSNCPDPAGCKLIGSNFWGQACGNTGDGKKQLSGKHFDYTYPGQKIKMINDNNVWRPCQSDEMGTAPGTIDYLDLSKWGLPIDANVAPGGPTKPVTQILMYSYLQTWPDGNQHQIWWPCQSDADNTMENNAGWHDIGQWGRETTVMNYTPVKQIRMYPDYDRNINSHVWFACQIDAIDQTQATKPHKNEKGARFVDINQWGRLTIAPPP